jgi:uncharacterized protein
MKVVSDNLDTQKPAGFVARHPVAVFFVLACVLSLGAIAFSSGYEVLDDTFTKMGIPPRTTLVLAAQVLQYNPDAWFGVLGLIYHPFTPTIAALCVVGYLGGWRGIRELLSRLRPWQSNVGASDGLKIWLIAIATFMALNGFSAWIASMIFGPDQFKWAPGQFGWIPVWGWLLAGLFTDGGGVGEELGWRGFGSSFLQAKYAPLKAAVFLGLLWAFWHFPVRVPELLEDPLFWVKQHIIFVITCVSATILIIYFSNRLGGCALIGVMIHSQMNDSFRMRGMLSGDAPGQTEQLLFELAYVIPELMAAVIIIYITKGQLGFNKNNPGRQIWTWPGRGSQKQSV